MHDIMLAHGDPRGVLWATEAGVSTCDPTFDSGCVSEGTQATHVSSYLRVARQFPYLRSMVIYNLRDKGTSARDRSASGWFALGFVAAMVVFGGCLVLITGL